MGSKVCTAILSTPGVKNHLFQAEAVDWKMKITDKVKFTEAASELDSQVMGMYGLDEGIVFNIEGVATVNEGLIDQIVKRQFSKAAMDTIATRAIGDSDVNFIFHALDKMQQMLPGTNVQVLTAEEIAERYGIDPAKSKGFIASDNTIVINAHKFTMDTPFHEFGHLAVRYTKTKDPSAYAKLIKAALNHKDFKKYESKYPELSQEEIAEELFVTEIGIRSAFSAAKDIKATNAIKNFFKQSIRRTLGITSDFNELTLEDSFNSVAKRYVDDLFSDFSVFQDMSFPQVDALIRGITSEPSLDAIEEELRYQGYIKKVNGKDVYFNKDREIVQMKREDYLNRMKKLISLRYHKADEGETSLEDSLKLLDEMNKNLKLTKDSKFYVDRNWASVKFKRTTSFVENFIAEFNVEKAAEMEFKSEFLKEQTMLFEKVNPEIKANLTEEAFKQEAFGWAEKEYNKLTEGQIELKINDILKKYDFKREHGTFVHSMAEDYINLVEKLKAKRKEYEDRGEDPRKAYIMVNDYHEVVLAKGAKQYEYDKDFNAAIKRFTPRKVYDFDTLATLEGTRPRIVKENGKVIVKDRRGISPIDNAVIRQARIDYLKTLNKTLKEFEKAHGIKNVMYKPEVRIHGGDYINYAGTIDLLAIDMDTNEVYIIDHKTKEKGFKYRDRWDAKFSKFTAGSAFENIYYNAENKAAIQTSIYAIILENMGYKVKGLEVFYTEGKINSASEHKGSKQYEDIEITRKPLEYYKGEVVQAFKDVEQLDLSDVSMDTRNDIQETYVKVFNNKDNDNFLPSDSYIDKLYKSIYEEAVVDPAAFMLGGSGSKTVKKVRIGGFDRTIPSSLTSEKEIKKFIIDKVSNLSALTDIELDAVKLFNDPDAKLRNNWLENDIRNMMKGITKETHDIIRLSTKSNFGKNFTGIIMFKDKITGEHRIVQLMAEPNENVNFAPGRHTIFGKYKSDSSVKLVKKGASNRAYLTYEATKIRLKMTKVAMAVAKMKSLDPDFSIDYVVATPPLKHGGRSNSGKVPILIDAHSLMLETKELMSMANAHGDLVGEVKTLFDNKMFDGDKYVANLPKKALQILDEMAQVYKKRKGDPTQEIKNELESYLNNEYLGVSTLVELLNNYVVNNRPGNDPYKHYLMRHIMRTILHLKGFRPSMITQDISMLDKFVSIPANSSNLYIQKISEAARYGRDKARDLFLDYTLDHKKALQKFLGRNSVNSQRTSTLPEFKAMFRPMDPTKPEDLYRFKEDSELTSAQRTYKKFFQDKFVEALTFTDPHKKKQIQAYIKAGYVPLVGTGFFEKLLHSSDFADASDTVKTELKFSASANQDNEEKQYDMDNIFAKEFGNEDMQGSFHRRMMLGINQEGVVDKIPEYEMDLEAILDRIYAQSTAVHFGRETLIVAKALGTEIKYQQGNFEYETAGLNEMVKLIGQVFIKNETEKTWLNNLTSKLNTFATFSTIAGSVRSMTLEAVTNALNTGKMWIREEVMARVFGVNQKFGTKEMLFASKEIIANSEKVNTLMLRFGILETDVRQLRRFTSAVQDSKFLKSENFFAVQAKVLAIAQSEIMVAIMKKDGAYEAYSVEDGKLIYDVKKDRRFYGNGGTQTAEQKALLEMAIKEARNDGTLDKEGKLTRGYSSTDIHQIKDYVVEAFSSMDMDSRNAMATTLFGKMLGKFRSWYAARVRKIFGGETQESLRTSEVVYERDADGKLLAKRVLNPDMGYIYTIGKIAKNLAIDGKNMEKLTEQDKSKLADAATDATMLLMLFLMFSLITCDDEQKKNGECWHKNSEGGKILYKALTDAPGDVFIPIVLWNTVAGDGAMFPTLAIVQGTVNKIYTTIAFGLEGDLEAAGNKAAEMTSLTKYVNLLSKDLLDEDSNK